MSEIDQNIRAKKSLGQNFLQDENIARKIVAALDAGKGDSVLEIGPGLGALTRHIKKLDLKRFAVIEKDRQLAEHYEQEDGVEVIHRDALSFPWESLAEEGRWHIVGNLPYNIASRIMWDMASRGGYRRAVFMIQHEVAARLVAESGTKAYGALTVWINNFARVEYLFKVGPNVFRPRPKVDSAVVRFTPLDPGDRPEDYRRLEFVIKKSFQKRRKQLGTIFKDELTADDFQDLEKVGISRTMRPERIEPAGFRHLAFKCNSQNSP